MIRRILLTGPEARKKLTDGANKLANAVKSTFGPYGQTFFIDKKNAITNDGVTVAREIVLPDEVENRGAIALKEAATKTVDAVGDGTTTAIILAQAIYDTVSKLLGKEGVIGSKTPADVVKQVEKECTEVISELREQATPIETKEQLINSATVSTGDRELGTLIGEAQWEVGKDGYLLAEETAERVSSVEYVKGIRIDNGFGTSMVINNVEKQTLEVKDVPVILTSYTIKDFRAISKTLDELLKSGKKEVVIIARAWTEESINLCQQNHKNGFLIYPLNAPYVDMAQRFLDLEAVTGAKFYDSESSDLNDLTISDIGFASRVVARRFDAIITGKEDTWTKDRIAARVEKLNEEKRGDQSDFSKKALSERIAQLQNGFGIIKVGSYSDMERRRLFDKCEDSVNAVRAAFQEGTVRGGGLAFKEISEKLPADSYLRRALMTPYEQIMSSAPKGFEVEDWVRDPVLVLRTALQNACTAATSFATAGGVITQRNLPELNELLGKVEKNS